MIYKSYHLGNGFSSFLLETRKKPAEKRHIEPFFYTGPSLFYCTFQAALRESHGKTAEQKGRQLEEEKKQMFFLNGSGNNIRYF